MMMDFDDGDLMSIVMSCGRAKNLTPTMTAASDPFSCLLASSSFSAPSVSPLLPLPSPPPSTPQFPTMSFSVGTSGGLEDLCMSFFPQPQPQQQKPLLLSSISMVRGMEPASRVIDLPTLPADALPKQKKQATSQDKRRKRRQQQKKVITQVPADRRMSNDNWAWRKYGQKPIKGSLHPRGYYKCSTKKECPARKHMEKSRTNPGMYIISYLGEHTHPLPANRNHLAGSSRNRFLSSSSSSVVGLSPKMPQMKISSSSDEKELEGDVEDEEELDVEDMEVIGEDELVFFGSGALDAIPGDSMVQQASCFEFLNVVDDPFFSPLWSNQDIN